MAQNPDNVKKANDQVQILEPTDRKGLKEAAICLAEAFEDDDVARYFVHTEPTGFKGWDPATLKLHQSICEYLVHAHCMKGLVTTTGPNHDSVALWMPPNKNMDDWLTMFRSGMWRLRYQLTPEGSHRFFKEFLPLLSETKLAALGTADDNNSWYLVYLGTKRNSRGRGYANALLEMVTKQADAEGLKCYLESSHEKNFNFYKRHGFEPDPKVPKIYLKRDQNRKIELDIMVREPDASKVESHTARSRDVEKNQAANGVGPVT